MHTITATLFDKRDVATHRIKKGGTVRNGGLEYSGPGLPFCRRLFSCQRQPDVLLAAASVSTATAPLLGCRGLATQSSDRGSRQVTHLVADWRGFAVWGCRDHARLAVLRPTTQPPHTIAPRAEPRRPPRHQVEQHTSRGGPPPQVQQGWSGASPTRAARCGCAPRRCGCAPPADGSRGRSQG